MDWFREKSYFRYDRFYKLNFESNKINNLGLYEWDDGTKLNYTNFVSVNPNQTCVYMYNNEWFDSECFVSKRIHVCKQSKSSLFE